jgi:hypothetical protein
MYTGANVLNRRSYKLGTLPRGRRNPRDQWILRENVFEPVIDSDVFRQAQEIAATRNPRYSDQDLLDFLKELLNRRGRLSVALIDADPQTPGARIYSERFGSMYEVYRRIGYEHGRRVPVIELAQQVSAHRRSLLSMIVSNLTAQGVDIRRDIRSGLLTINEEFTIRVAVVGCVGKSVGYRWKFRLDSTLDSDITILARLVRTNDSIKDYYLLPHTQVWPHRLTVGPDKDLVSGIYQFEDLSFLASLARRVGVRDVEAQPISTLPHGPAANLQEYRGRTGSQHDLNAARAREPPLRSPGYIDWAASIRRGNCRLDAWGGLAHGTGTVNGWDWTKATRPPAVRRNGTSIHRVLPLRREITGEQDAVGLLRK